MRLFKFCSYICSAPAAKVELVATKSIKFKNMKAPKVEPREQTPEGVHQAICIKVIDWGTQSGSYQGKPTKRRMLNVGFELLGKGLKTEQGEPFVNYKTYTFSIGKKANLAIDIKGWLSVKDLAEYDFENLIGKKALVTITHKDSADGTASYANITNISALPKEMKELKGSQPYQTFFLDENYSLEEFNSLGDYDKNKIAASEEYPGWLATMKGNKKVAATKKGK